ncbi:MAG: nitroreductase [Dehalococcoidales bacterium]|nr:MAG: nitroreductase [Dehalococcoidales bacterium]
MELKEAINKRKTTRGFTDKPVPKEILEEIMKQALRAPSWGNTQPWEFVIAGGNVLSEIKQAYLDKAEENPSPDLPFPQQFPEFIRERLPYARRQQPPDNRDPKEILKERQVMGSRMYEAPAVIYMLTDREMYEQDGNNKNTYAIFDCGLIAQTIMLLAVEHGLGTVAAAQSVRCPEVLREKLEIPESKVVVLGLIIGYPDTENPQYNVYSDRVPLEEITRWYGFE